MTVISVVIPTYNRADILKKCLAKLKENTFSKEKYEIIIVNDGSTDHTKQVVDEFSAKFEKVVYLEQKNSGQGKARNIGIKKAKGKIILLIGDDIFASKTFLQEHYEVHRKNPEYNYACLGLILWDPEINITKVMQWSTNELTFFGKFGGHQFAFNHLKGKTFADYNYFYTSNISIKKELLEKHHFDLELTGYGWEDIELAYRLEQKENLKIIYNPAALAYHHHEIDEEQMLKRMESIGSAAVKFNTKHPELKKVPGPFKKLTFKIISSGLLIKILRSLNKITKEKTLPIYYYCLSKKHFLIGLQKQVS